MAATKRWTVKDSALRWEAYRRAAEELEKTKRLVNAGDSSLISEEYRLENVLDESWEHIGLIAEEYGDTEARIVFLHYLQGKPWKVVANECETSKRTAQRYGHNAIEWLESRLRSES